MHTRFLLLLHAVLIASRPQVGVAACFLNDYRNKVAFWSDMGPAIPEQLLKSGPDGDLLVLERCEQNRRGCCI